MFRNGDKRYIRREYTEIGDLDQVATLQAQLAEAQAQIDATKNQPVIEPQNPQEGEGNDPQ